MPIVKFILIICLFLMNACTSNKAIEKQRLKQKKIAEINIQLGMGYLENGELPLAKRKLMYAMQKAPNLPESWYSLAHYFEVTGNKERARFYYSKSMQLAPHRGDVLNNYGTYLCRSGKYLESIHYFLEAVKDPGYLDLADAYENAGLCALKIPDKRQALSYFTAALDQDPTRILSMTEATRLKV